MPLEGIKIIQMECFGPANFAAWMLGDLRADTLLVELPNPRPYPTRDPDVTDEIRFPGHALENRNKRSIALNLKDEAARDPQVQHWQMIQNVTLPDGRTGRQLGIPIKFSDTPARLRDPAPRRGQHTVEILQGLGYDQDQIAVLQASGVIAVDKA